ncbi:MAG: exodeoxyribonuclease VII small subunit [Gammaproteobacteria bacterium]|nr:exodeoxyribonuclease VII small subunit [Gammaproteobacteria bacterium]
MPTTRKTINFEKSMDQLNQLIEKMETGQLSLEASLQHFEQGISLIRQCQQTLTNAEQKIQVLTEKAGKTTLEDFNTHDE